MSTLSGARGVIAGAALPLGGPAAASARRAHGDRVLFAALVALLAVGLLAVTTASAPISLDRFGTPHHYVVRHLLHLVVGVAVMAVLWTMDVRRLDHPLVVHVLWAVVLVLLVACLFEAPAGGARR